MRPTSPRSSLGNKSPMQRFEEKTSLACAWIGLFGHTTEAVLRTFIGVQATGFCPRLVRKGLLTRVPIPGSVSCAWALTAAGVLRAEWALQRGITYLSHPSRVSLARFAHDLAVQREVLVRLNLDLRVLRGVRADRELQHWATNVRPDLVVRYVEPSGKVTLVCVELELSSKSTKELRRKMERMLGVLRPGMVWCWYICEGAAARDRYQATWLSVVDEHGAGHGLDPEALRKACRFEVAAASTPKSA